MPKQTNNSMFKRGNHVTFVGNVPNKFKFGVDPQGDLAQYPRSGDQGKVGRKIGSGWYLVKLDRNGAYHKVRAGPYMKMTSKVEAAEKELGNNSAPGLDLLIRTNQVEALQQENQRLAAAAASAHAELNKVRNEMDTRLDDLFDKYAVETFENERQAHDEAIRNKDLEIASLSERLETLSGLSEVNALRNDESLAYHKAMSDKDLEIASLRNQTLSLATSVLQQQNLIEAWKTQRAEDTETISRLTLAVEEARKQQQDSSGSECECSSQPNEPETSEAWNPSMPVRWGTEHEEADKAAAAEYCTEAVLEDGEWVEPDHMNLQTTTWGGDWPIR